MASDFSTILQKLENLANANNNSISSLDVMNIIEEQDGDPDLVDKLFDELESSAVSLESCRENIALAEESYSLVSKAYNAGSADFIEVRDAEEQLNKSRLSEQSELYTYICALTDLEYMLDLPDGWRNK